MSQRISRHHSTISVDLPPSIVPRSPTAFSFALSRGLGSAFQSTCSVHRLIIIASENVQGIIRQFLLIYCAPSYQKSICVFLRASYGLQLCISVDLLRPSSGNHCLGGYSRHHSTISVDLTRSIVPGVQPFFIRPSYGPTFLILVDFVSQARSLGVTNKQSSRRPSPAVVAPYSSRVLV